MQSFGFPPQDVQIGREASLHPREPGAIGTRQTGPEFKELARNDLGDRSVFNATLVVSNGQLLLRSDKFLYCIGK